MSNLGTDKVGQNPGTISVVMPSLNQAAYLGAAVKSVLDQDWSALELIVMDGGSTDGSLILLESFRKRYGGRLRWFSTEDDGASDALNKAFSLANGEFIGWLNSDDMYAEGAVRSAINYLSARPELMLVYGEGRHLGEDGGAKERYPTRVPPLRNEDLLEGCPICQPTVFFRREVLSEVGMLDKSLKVAFDFELWLRIFRRYPHQVAYMDRLMAYSRLHPDCKTVRLRRDVALEGMQVTARHIGHASPHWIFTWLDELFSTFPFGGEPPNARQWIMEGIAVARGYLSGECLDDFDRRINSDARLLAMDDNAYIPIHPDGWLESGANLRVRKMAGSTARRIHIRCRHASPMKAGLAIRVSLAEETVLRQEVTSAGPFSLHLDLPDSDGRAAWFVFHLDVDGCFVPARVEAGSLDKRLLAFLVDGIEWVD